MQRRLVLAILVSFAVGSGALAHGPKHKGAANDNVADVEGGHLELVVMPAEIRILVSDQNDQPLSSAGLAARAIVQDGPKQIVLPLTPQEPNLLVAPLASPLSRGTKIAISTTLTKNGKPVQARFVVK